MNDTIGLTREVEAFVGAVRARFAALDADEREDLLDGLEADTADLVAERGPEALGDPDAYAEELRAAAGLPPASAVPRGRQPIVVRIEGLLDGAHTRWVDLVSGLPADPWGFVQSLRPFWWVARAWVAVQAVDLIWGNGSTNLGLSPIPSLGSFGLVALLVAIFGSVQLGRGKLWPGRPRSGTGGRVLLLVLNLAAIALTPAVATSLFTPEKAVLWGMTDTGYSQPYSPQGLSFNGAPISNLYPYDAAGNPLIGVQLVDDEGRRLKVNQDALMEWEMNERVLSPWLNGRTPLFSVFPLPEQARDYETGNVLGEPALQTPPFAVLPPVTLEGVTPTTTAPPQEDPVEKRRAAGKKRP